MKAPFLLSTLLSLLLTVPASATPAETVSIDGGVIAGSSNAGIASWKGIPFAAPPTGALRWRAPQPVVAWSGVRPAKAYGPDCMQKPFGGDAAPLGTTPAEDCLYANVWRPVATGRKLPVLVWIYGGGFVNGGASPPTYSGAALARQGVLVVSFNYRVGRFGTFAHPALTRAGEDAGLLGNYGYLDQIAALRWVRHNIAAFGGDPANVTIVGESAGGMSVHALVTSPMAKGLFARAVVMSGGDGTSMANADLPATEEIGERFARARGVADDDPQALTKLRALPAEDVVDGLDLMALFAPGPAPRTFASPFADGRIAIDQRKAYSSGEFAHVPMMIGATSADIGGPQGMMITGARTLSDMISRQNLPVYAYRFSYVASSIDSGKGAGHASDIPFFFDTQGGKYGARTSARDNAAGRIASAYLVNFAKTGNPNGIGLPTWRRYSPGAQEIMDLSASGSASFGKDPLAQ